MIKVYGIKTCGSVQKALKYFKDKAIDVEFCDFRATPVDQTTINQWLEKIPLATLFNTKGTKYKTLGLSSMNLDDEGKKKWLADENLLFKRPVITRNDQAVVVGFDEARYNELF
jgi:Spx/MgsR family transcriptional regulator